MSSVHLALSIKFNAYVRKDERTSGTGEGEDNRGTGHYHNAMMFAPKL